MKRLALFLALLVLALTGGGCAASRQHVVQSPLAEQGSVEYRKVTIVTNADGTVSRTEVLEERTRPQAEFEIRMEQVRRAQAAADSTAAARGRPQSDAGRIMGYGQAVPVRPYRPTGRP